VLKKLRKEKKWKRLELLVMEHTFQF
jgi:hypothetical protein